MEIVAGPGGLAASGTASTAGLLPDGGLVVKGAATVIH